MPKIICNFNDEVVLLPFQKTHQVEPGSNDSEFFTTRYSIVIQINFIYYITSNTVPHHTSSLFLPNRWCINKVYVNTLTYTLFFISPILDKVLQKYLPHSTDYRQYILASCDDQYWTLNSRGVLLEDMGHSRLPNEVLQYVVWLL